MIEQTTTDDILEELGLRLQKRNPDVEQFKGHIDGRRVTVAIQRNSDDNPPTITGGTAVLQVIVHAPELQTRARIGKRQNVEERDVQSDLDTRYYFGASPDWLMSVVQHELVMPLVLRTTEPVPSIDADPQIILEPGQFIFRTNILDRAMLHREYLKGRIDDALYLTQAIETVPRTFTPIKQNMLDKMVRAHSARPFSAVQIVGLLLIAIAVLSGVSIAVNSSS